MILHYKKADKELNYLLLRSRIPKMTYLSALLVLIGCVFGSTCGEDYPLAARLFVHVLGFHKHVG